MPIFLEPQELRLFWLASDADKPLVTRPVFECRSPSLRITNQLNVIAEQMDAEGVTDADYVKLLLDSVLLGVTGWRNMGERKFSREALEELSRGELHELAAGWPKAFELGRADLKNSSSPSPSSAAASAKPAETESASTSQPATNPAG